MAKGVDLESDDGDSSSMEPGSILAAPSSKHVQTPSAKRQKKDTASSIANPKEPDSDDDDDEGAPKHKRARYMSGAEKRRKGKGVSEVRRCRADDDDDSEDAEAGGDGDDSAGDDDLALDANFKIKTCDICSAKNSDPDPVAQRLKKVSGCKKRSALLRWEKHDGRGGCCYYCARVHERRYGMKNRRELKEYLREPSDNGEVSRMEIFESERGKAIELLASGSIDRLPAHFGTLDIPLPQQRVELKSRKYERVKRKGKNMRLDVFLKHFPDRDPKKAGHIFERRDSNGMVRQWVKMYDNEEGVEEFSEGDVDEVEKSLTIDDGRLILADSQIDDVFTQTSNMCLTKAKQGGFTRADLGLSHDFLQPVASNRLPTTTPEKDKIKRRMHSAKEVPESNDGSKEDDELDEINPLARSLRMIAEKDKDKDKKGRGKQGRGHQEGTGKNAKTVDRCVKLAEEFVKKVRAFAPQLKKSSVDDVGSQLADLQKLVSESKFVQVAVLIRGQQAHIASEFNDCLSAAKTMQTYVKAFLALQKARLEGRVGKSQQKAKNSVEKQFSTATEDLAKHRVQEPVWGLAAKMSMGIDAALGAEQPLKALSFVKLEHIKQELGVSTDEAQTWMDKWAGEILVNIVKSKDADASRTMAKQALADLSTDEYTPDLALKKKMGLLSTLLDPTRYTVDDLMSCLRAINDERSNKSAFWMLFMDQPGARSLIQHVEQCIKTMGAEPDFIQAFDKVNGILNSLSESISADTVDHAQLYSMLKEHANTLPMHIAALAAESEREAFLVSRAGPVKQALQKVTIVAHELDAKFVFSNWRAVALAVESWRRPMENDMLESVMAKLAFLSDYVRRLDKVELGSHIKQGQFVAQKLFAEPAVGQWVEDLRFRHSICICIQHSRALEAVVPEVVPDKIGENFPELFPKLVEVCRALDVVEAVLLTTGPPGALITQEDDLALRKCMAEGPRLLINKWTQCIIAERRAEFDSLLCKRKFPERHIDTFLPPGQSEEDLNKCAGMDKSTLADQLALLYGSVDMRYEQAVVLAEASLSRMQSWAAKLLLSWSTLPAVASITFKSLNVDANTFTALKAFSSEEHKAEEILQSMASMPNKGDGLNDTLSKVLAEGKAFTLQKRQNFDERLCKLVAAATKVAKQHTPNWRSFVLESPDPNRIKNELIESKSSNNLRAIYPVLSALYKDVEAADSDLELHLKVKIRPELDTLESAMSEIKLVLGVEHVCNVVHVLGPAAKGAKAKAGLLRELKAKLSKAHLMNLVPAEIMLQAQNILVAAWAPHAARGCAKRLRGSLWARNHVAGRRGAAGRAQVRVRGSAL